MSPKNVFRVFTVWFWVALKCILAKTILLFKLILVWTNQAVFWRLHTPLKTGSSMNRVSKSQKLLKFFLRKLTPIFILVNRPFFSPSKRRERKLKTTKDSGQEKSRIFGLNEDGAFAIKGILTNRSSHFIRRIISNFRSRLFSSKKFWGSFAQKEFFGETARHSYLCS